MALAHVQERNLWFCSLGNNPIQWHSELDLPVDRTELLNFPASLLFTDYTLTVYGSDLVVIGGILMGQPSSGVWSMNSMQNEWKGLPSMLTARSSVIAVGYGDHLVAAGGKCGNKICHEVEVFNGDKWSKIKPFAYPKSPNELTSVLHADNKWYIMESNGCAVRATYSAPIDDIISGSSTYEWKVHSAESCPPCGILPPISFDGQLIVVGNNGDNEKPKLYFCSPDFGSWVSFEKAPYIGQYCNIVGIVSVSDQKALMLIYKGAKKCTIKMITYKGNHYYCIVLSRWHAWVLITSYFSSHGCYNYNWNTYICIKYASYINYPMECERLPRTCYM